MAVAFLSAQRSKDPATQVNSLLSQMQFIHSYCSVVFFLIFLWVIFINSAAHYLTVTDYLGFEQYQCCVNGHWVILDVVGQTRAQNWGIWGTSSITEVCVPMTC